MLLKNSTFKNLPIPLVSHLIRRLPFEVRSFVDVVMKSTQNKKEKEL